MVKSFSLIFLVFSLMLTPSSSWGQADEDMGEYDEMKFSYMDPLDLKKNYFEHETRLGASFSTGNTNSISISGKTDTIYRIKRWQNNWSAGGYYDRLNATTGSATPGTIARYIWGFYRLDYYFLPTTSFFIGGGGYTDTIKGIDLAGIGFIGVAHFLIHSNDVTFMLAGGYSYTRQNQVSPNPDRNIHAAKIELDYQHQLNKLVRFSQNVNYLQSVTSISDIRVNSETTLKVKMTKHLALYLGFELRFNNQPPTGFRKVDTLTDFGLSVNLGGKANDEKKSDQDA